MLKPLVVIAIIAVNFSAQATELAMTSFPSGKYVGTMVDVLNDETESKAFPVSAQASGPYLSITTSRQAGQEIGSLLPVRFYPDGTCEEIIMSGPPSRGTCQGGTVILRHQYEEGSAQVTDDKEYRWEKDILTIRTVTTTLTTEGGVTTKKVEASEGLLRKQ